MIERGTDQLAEMYCADCGAKGRRLRGPDVFVCGRCLSPIKKAHAMLRTKPLVEAITKEIVLGARVLVAEYQPGDGTRYELLFTEVGDAVSGGTDAVIVTLINFPHAPSMSVEKRGGFLAPSYVAEKLGVGDSSSVTLAEVIAHFVGLEAYTPDRYREVSTGSGSGS